MSTARGATSIKPPDDAPIPWGAGGPCRDFIFDARGEFVAEFNSAAAGTYAVAAANALPGLAGLARELLAWSDAPFDDAGETIDGFASLVDRTRAALAALPKGVRP